MLLFVPFCINKTFFSSIPWRTGTKKIHYRTVLDISIDRNGYVVLDFLKKYEAIMPLFHKPHQTVTCYRCISSCMTTRGTNMAYLLINVPAKMKMSFIWNIIIFSKISFSFAQYIPILFKQKSIYMFSGGNQWRNKIKYVSTGSFEIANGSNLNRYMDHSLFQSDNEQTFQSIYIQTYIIGHYRPSVRITT